uniref:Uncharacterized protein n=1 Tax=Lepeophtheirus salmonis TaxID=72036 RepID=A0A0K2U800_LEPSM
MTMRKPPGFR